MKFISVSKEGYVGLWTINFKLEKVYSATDEANNNVSSIGQNRRRAGMWITDAIYMADVHKLVLASTSRELRFFTISSETFLEEFALFGILKEKINDKFRNLVVYFRCEKCSNLFRLLSNSYGK
jgi:hypothetical protein